MAKRKRKSRFPIWLILLITGGYFAFKHTPAFETLLPKVNEITTPKKTADNPRPTSDKSKPIPQSEKKQSLQLGLEIPQPTRKHNEIVVRHTGFTLSYNPEMLTPHWVAWELDREETEGDEGREDQFMPDPELPEPRVTHRDYSNSGYDRGHMAPAADMKWSKTTMQESFYTSNICPQNRKLNRDDWKDLENACRDWARKYGTIYIACGPIYDNPHPKRIGEHGVAVPDRFYKVILVYNRKNPFTLAFIFRNEGHHQDLSKYQTTVDTIEDITGFDFFAKVPDSIEQRIESVITPLP